MGSTYIESWNTSKNKYPDFVAEGSGDQRAIMGAICGVKQASFDGVDCVGEDDAATGTVSRSGQVSGLEGDSFVFQRL